MMPTRAYRFAVGRIGTYGQSGLLAAALIGLALLVGGSGTSPQLNGLGLVTHASATESTRPPGFADIVERVKPAVIAVRVKVENKVGPEAVFPFDPGSPLERFFREYGFPEGIPRHRFSRAQGSGLFISADGYAVTNNHVVKGTKSVEVATDDGKTYSAKVVGADAKTDIALLKVEGRENFPYVTFAEDAPRIGDWVIAVGNPFGLGGSVTAGIVSARGRDIGAGPYDDFIQIDAPINKGNSGGPAFDGNGNVIGVTTAIYSPTVGSIGIGFAIPADAAQSVVAQLKDTGFVTRGWIGVRIQSITPDMADALGMKQARGVLIVQPQQGGPAAEAGIKARDVITSVNGQDVKNSRDLAKKIAASRPGSKVELGVLRNGAEKKISLTVGEMPRERQAGLGFKGPLSGGAAPLGLTLVPASSVAGVGDRGVVVIGVSPDGPAVAAGIRSGDVILEVAGEAVNSPSDVRKEVRDAAQSDKRHVLMRVKSGDVTRFVALAVSEG
jgi:serine protease Do